MERRREPSKSVIWASRTLHGGVRTLRLKLWLRLSKCGRTLYPFEHLPRPQPAYLLETAYEDIGQLKVSSTNRYLGNPILATLHWLYAIPHRRNRQPCQPAAARSRLAVTSHRRLVHQAAAHDLPAIIPRRSRHSSLESQCCLSSFRRSESAIIC
jgi:hypothetical protein